MGSLLGKVICVLTWLVQYRFRGCVGFVRVPVAVAVAVAAVTIGLARAVERKRDAGFALAGILPYEAKHVFHRIEAPLFSRGYVLDNPPFEPIGRVDPQPYDEGTIVSQLAVLT